MSGEILGICYYSNGCKWSKAFLEELNKTPWKHQFKFICADQPQNRPPWLKKVPTLVIKGEQEPLTDSEVMNWLYEKKMREGGGDQQQGGHQGPVPGMGGDPDAWNPIELGDSGGFSYSRLDVDTTVQGAGGSSMPGAYSFLNGAAGAGTRDGIGLSGAVESARKKSKKEEMFDKQMEEYQRQRSMGIPQLQKRM